MEITIEAQTELVRKGLQRLAAEPPKVGRLQIYRTLQAIQKEVKHYPPEPPGSTYTRTYNLRKSVLIRRLSKGYELRINPVGPTGVPYGIYVLGDVEGRGQARKHVGRWPLIQSTMAREINKLPDNISRELVMRSKAYGLI